MVGKSDFVTPQFLKSLETSCLPCFQLMRTLEPDLITIKQPIILQTFMLSFHHFLGSTNLVEERRQNDCVFLGIKYLP